MKVKLIYGLMVMGMLLVGMPVIAQQQEWKSTSSMAGAGSAYSTQVTAVGATSVQSMATTTESYSPAKGPNRAKKEGEDDWGYNQNGGYHDEDNSPLGDAILPLSLMAVAFCGVVYLRRRKRAVKAPSV